jgi:hypothetical protein
MRLPEWAPLVDERLVQRAPSLSSALRGRAVSGRLAPRDAAIVFQQPQWRSAYGFVSVWPSRWPPTEDDDHARAVFFGGLPLVGEGGDSQTELRYGLHSSGAEEAARDIAAFLAPHESDVAWSHRANLREPTDDADSFLTALVHEFGHAVTYAVKGTPPEFVIIYGIEADADSVRATGGRTERYLGRGSFVGTFRKWDDAVGSVGGLVAERLFVDRGAAFADPIALFLADRSLFSDMEEAIARILVSRGCLTMAPTTMNELLSEAIAEAHAVLGPRIDGIVREARTWRAKALAGAMSELQIPWGELRSALRSAR